MSELIMSSCMPRHVLKTVFFLVLAFLFSTCYQQKPPIAPVTIPPTENNNNDGNNNAASDYGLQMDGIDDFATINDNGRLNLGKGNFTFEAKVKFFEINTARTIQMIMGKRNASVDEGFMFGVWFDGHVYVQLKNAPNIGYDQGPNVLDGKCHHIAVTRSGLDTLKFYVDGNLYYKARRGTDIGSLGPMWIGVDLISGYNLNGILDEIRIWNIARSASDLVNYANATLKGDEAGLLGCFKFGEGKGRTFKDITNSGLVGKFAGSDTTDASDPTWTSEICKN